MIKLWLEIKNFLKTKEIKTKTTKKTLPTKHHFGGLDRKKWGLASVDFYPFAENDFADNIFKIMLYLPNKPENEELLDTLNEAINFSRSTIILKKNREFQRVFFESEKNLENFLINYTE
jgi:hypothetical protein